MTTDTGIGDKTMTDEEREREEDLLWEVGAVAERLHLHPATIRLWCNEGKIEAIRLSHKWLIPESAIQTFLAEHRPEVV